MAKFITGEQFGRGLKEAVLLLDDKISKGGGTYNPLTTEPLEYGMFGLNEHFASISVNTYVPLPKVITGNLASTDKGIKLKGGKTYSIDASSFTNGGGFIVVQGVLVDELTNTEKVLLTIYTEPNNSSSQNCNMPTANGIFDVATDGYFKFKISSLSGYVPFINKDFTYVTIKEYRNNPVNQYGGFEAEVLFDGEANNTTTKYSLSDTISNYDFIVVETTNNDLENITPIMTSNTTPSPYLVKASGEFNGTFEAYKAFDSQIYESGGWQNGDVGSNNGWLEIVNPNGFEFDMFAISDRGSTQWQGSPSSVKVSISDDGVSYVPVKTFSELSFGVGETKEFILDSTTVCKHIKFDFEHRNGYVNIGEMKLFKTKKNVLNNSGIYNTRNSSINTGGYHLDLKDESFCIYSDSQSISRIIGVKGQLPSLLVGGEF